MKIKLSLTLAVAALFANSLFAQSDAEFKKMVVNYWQTWSAMNPDKSAVMYAKNTDAVFFDVAPMKYTGWQEYADGVKKAFATTASAKFTADDDITVSRHGNFAWTTDTFHGVLTGKDGKLSNLNGRHTAIWQKISGKWLIVHDHVSVPMSD
jgi:ketosteroid isomerase-like protein